MDPNFSTNHFMRPRPVHPPVQMEAEGYHESWITYKSPEHSAKELMVFPGKTVTLKDGGAYGPGTSTARRSSDSDNLRWTSSSSQKRRRKMA